MLAILPTFFQPSRAKANVGPMMNVCWVSNLIFSRHSHSKLQHFYPCNFHLFYLFLRGRNLFSILPMFRFPPRTYPVQVAHTFSLFLIFSYSTIALPARPCRKLSLGPQIHNVALFNLPCTLPSTFLKQTALFHQHSCRQRGQVVKAPGS